MRKTGYRIRLKPKEKERLHTLVSKGMEKARVLTRSRILLLSDQEKKQGDIARALSVSRPTVAAVCGRYLEEGLEAALRDKPRPGAPTVFEGKHKAKITALACSTPPEGYSQWSLRLLADRAVELKIVPSISHTDVGRILKKMKSNRT